MEVYQRSSWFLLLLGFALLAVTLQEATDCPKPDEVSCTSGTKCDSDGDCKVNEKCCANACYTKRCTPTSKGVQGDAETGPTETDCRPYIEKALKELEIGETAHVTRPSEKEESGEDIPTVEITDESSHQEKSAEERASDEAETRKTSIEEEQETETVQQSSHGIKDQEESGETPDEKTVEYSEEKIESEKETTPEPSKKESAEHTEEVKVASLEDKSREMETLKHETQEAAKAESEGAEAVEIGEPAIVKREIPVGAIPVQTGGLSKEIEESAEAEQPPSVEDQGKSQETEETLSVEQQRSVEETAKSKEESGEDDQEREHIEQTATDSKKEQDKLSEEEAQSEEQTVTAADSSQEGGCPSPDKVSCTEGEICSKHRHCNEDQICCTNKCYRKRCTPGSVPQEERDAESASEESVEIKIDEKPAPSISETGCPPPSEVSCTEGELCSKHRHCGKGTICCSNKCYRKRCTPGTATSAELAEESQEESKEETQTESIEKKAADKRPETGCPLPSEVSCTEGELCSKHRHCGEGDICCPNKCYRKRCTRGTATSAELAEESEEESREVTHADSTEKKVADKKPETGCPSPSEVSCTEGELCSKHRHCGEGDICCPNKCYRKRCTPGTATSAELIDESEEESKEETQVGSTEKKTADNKPDTGCPAPSDLSCAEGELCSKHRHCGPNEICCTNKCYRKRCTPGTATEEELAAEGSEESKEEETKSQPVPSTPRKDSGCPERSDVPCGGELCNKNRHCETGQICCGNKCYRKVCIDGTPGSEEKEDDESEEVVATIEKSVETLVEDQAKDGCPSPDKVSCKEGEKCSDDDDCGPNEICCPNKCYNKRCIPGTKAPKEENVEEEELLSLPRAQPKEKEIKPRIMDQPPKPISKQEVRQEVKLPQHRVPAKPIKVVEPVVEEDESLEKGGEAPVEELSLDTDIPTNLRPREHVEHLLKLDQGSSTLENIQNRVYEETLKELKKFYENAIKPLEVLYKYRDLSNRHFGDAEIFSKPLILFMGPWSGGKSSIINYLVNNEYNETALRTGAEPSPAYFNILMYGDEPEIIDGTQLAADFTFSGLQKFGQGLEERLRGVKLPSKLLEKVNIVEIPGILEVRKQVSRVFPFNDACQWFIDRADIIFLVYDPSKLDVGPETEAILDQLKGREHQTRIILNKADQVKPEELMRVQGALIWNISPLMSSPQPPVMYTTSLWSRPYEPWAPVRLLQAQERAFLRDLRSAIDRRVENKIASARRFAVRVRNHAKMVDCYLTTYYNHKSVFGNRKQVANEIIEHPQDYHIYEGLSTLTNISRYDLPDPDVYRDFFKLNPLYEFQQLSATCTYFRGCPINKLDIAIAYDLPELVGTYKRNIEEAIVAANNPPKESSSSSKRTKKSAPGS